MKDRKEKKGKNKEWFVYILRCSDNSLYTGITTDLERRLAEHNSPDSVTRYTRSRQPVTMVYHEQVANRSIASSREHKIKKMSKVTKERMLSGGHQYRVG